MVAVSILPWSGRKQALKQFRTYGAPAGAHSSAADGKRDRARGAESVE